MTASIEDIVRHKLPFLESPADDVALALEIMQSFYALQPYLKKTDVEVETVASYSSLEILLVAYYTAYNLVSRRNTVVLQEQSQGDGQFPIKKVKADVVETEFDTSNKSSLISVESIMGGLKLLICQTASSLQIRLPMCKELTKEKITYIPFKVYR